MNLPRKVYIERGDFMLHLYVRRADDDGLRWGYSLRVGGRSLLFGGRR